MKQFFNYKENITEIENENLRNIGFTPEVLQTLFLFAFDKEFDNDLFEIETISHNASMLDVFFAFDNETILNTGSMLNVWPIYLYWVKRDEELFNENFDGLCEFFDALVEEFRRNITSDNIYVDWQVDINEENIYVIFVNKERDEYDDEDDDQEDEDEEHYKLFYVWLYEGGDDGADDAGKDYFKDYDDAVAYADAFVKDCDIVGKFVDDGNYIWNLKKGERIAIVRNYDNEDLYMTDICTVK